ncbi:MAG: DUF1223 domain-containing protein [Methylococcaceae bacterium]|jgi:hypothetical protein
MRSRIFVKPTWILMLLSTLFAASVNAECTSSSPAHSVAVLELYTSEGCSSCPPADRWLSSIAAAGFNPDQVIPLAFHVDYWDYIGWKDRFAKPAYSERQRDQVILGGRDTAFTPQIMLNGKNYRGWLSDATFARDLVLINKRPAIANIQLNLAANANAITIKAAVTATVPTQKEAELYLAVYENDLNSAVRAGENRGEKLHHDYVVREWLGPYSLEGTTQSINLNPEWKKTDLGVVALIQNRHSGEILQAVTRKICS